MGHYYHMFVCLLVCLFVVVVAFFFCFLSTATYFLWQQQTQTGKRYDILAALLVIDCEYSLILALAIVRGGRNTHASARNFETTWREATWREFRGDVTWRVTPKMRSNFRRSLRVASPRNFAPACVCISPAPQSPSPKLETTRSLC